MNIQLWCVAFFLVSFLIMAIVDYNIQLNNWNNGICRISGKPWTLCKVTELNDRIYLDGCGHILILNYDFETR